MRLKSPRQPLQRPDQAQQLLQQPDQAQQPPQRPDQAQQPLQRPDQAQQLLQQPDQAQQLLQRPDQAQQLLEQPPLLLNSPPLQQLPLLLVRYLAIDGEKIISLHGAYMEDHSNAILIVVLLSK